MGRIEHCFTWRVGFSSFQELLQLNSVLHSCRMFDLKVCFLISECILLSCSMTILRYCTTSLSHFQSSDPLFANLKWDSCLSNREVTFYKGEPFRLEFIVSLRFTGTEPPNCKCSRREIGNLSVVAGRLHATSSLIFPQKSSCIRISFTYDGLIRFGMFCWGRCYVLCSVNFPWTSSFVNAHASSII